MYAATDTEAYEAFDIEYEYDLRDAFDAYLDGKGSLTHWLDLLNFQDFAYPKGYNKLRYLENHDTDRIAGRTLDEFSLENYTALLFFLKGTTLLYGGQEFAVEHRPTLFDADPVEWDTGRDLSPLITKLAELKKETLSADDLFMAEADEDNDIAVLVRDDGQNQKLGVFSLKGRSCNVSLKSRSGDIEAIIPDGTYDELISGGKVSVVNGCVECTGDPIWISIPSRVEE